MKHRLPVLAASLVAIGLIGALTYGDSSRTTTDVEDRGHQLARHYCSTCHELPAPTQIPRESWAYVVAWMGNYLGIRNTEGFLANVVNPRSIPARPLVTEDDLALIEAYFASNATPGPLLPSEKPAAQEGIPWLQPTASSFLAVRNAIITTLEIDEVNHRLFVGHGNENRLMIFDDGGTLLGSVRFDTQPIAVTVHDGGFYATLIGDLMKDTRNGQVLDLRLEDGRIQGDRLVSGYHRTVHTEFGDLTRNGRTDFVVSGFGDFELGRLAWFENAGERGFTEHVLLDHSGALKAEIHDFDGDGLRDIMTLVAQGRQELLLFLNRGDGTFESIKLLQEFPGFGFNGLELADFDGDGRMDVLLINGNNMEIDDPPLRDYHGLRIYLNQGDLRFQESYFYPMYGAMGARVADFSGDGRPDIAAIAAFPDWSAERPEGFVLLEQTGPLQFTPRTHPATRNGRWMTIDAGDLNGDGTADIALGGAAFLHGIRPHLQREFLQRFNQLPPVLLLENLRPAAAR